MKAKLEKKQSESGEDSLDEIIEKYAVSDTIEGDGDEGAEKEEKKKIKA